MPPLPAELAVAGGGGGVWWPVRLVQLNMLHTNLNALIC